MVGTHALTDERVRFFRAVALMAAAGLLMAYASGSYGVDPPRVVDSFSRAREQGDLDRALNHLAEDAVVRFERGRPQVVEGKSEIRDFLQVLDAASPPVVTVTPRQATEQSVTWSERSQDDSARELTAEAVVESGKITSLVYRSGTLVAAESAEATSVTPLPTSAMLAGCVLFGVGIVSLLTLRGRGVSSSALRGRLVGHLRHWHRRRPVSPSTP
jgi:hypothetical protein